ncbi:class I SAM-dependent methyltransferase [Micromonospora sp. NPDC003197]
MTSRTASALADLQRKVRPADPAGDDHPGLDQLRLGSAPAVPEIRLHLAEDAMVWWARMEAEAGEGLTPPFWATAWSGGQAIARYLLDNPETVTGRRVLDLATGSGLAAIAAARAGAAAVTANDVDPYALAAVIMNARANDVSVATSYGDLLDGDGGDAEVVLAGDVFYSEPMAQRMLPFIERVTRRGARMLIGDPGRAHLPRERLRVLASYQGSTAGAFGDFDIERMDVLEPVR